MKIFKIASILLAFIICFSALSLGTLAEDGESRNLALGKKFEGFKDPAATYIDVDPGNYYNNTEEHRFGDLTDGLIPDNAVSGAEEWNVGTENPRFRVFNVNDNVDENNKAMGVIDLGDVYSIDDVSVYLCVTLAPTSTWLGIYAPDIMVEVSENGSDYKSFGAMNGSIYNSKDENFFGYAVIGNTAMNARYVRVTLMLNNDRPALLGEIQVNGGEPIAEATESEDESKAESAPESNTDKADGSEESTASTDEKGGNNNVLYIVIGAIVIVAICGAVIVALGKKKKD